MWALASFWKNKAQEKRRGKLCLSYSEQQTEPSSTSWWLCVDHTGSSFQTGKAHYLIKGIIILPISLVWLLMTQSFLRGGPSPGNKAGDWTVKTNNSSGTQWRVSPTDKFYYFRPEGSNFPSRGLQCQCKSISQLFTKWWPNTCHKQLIQGGTVLLHSFLWIGPSNGNMWQKPVFASW